jgi:hypothetical protein
VCKALTTRMEWFLYGGDDDDGDDDDDDDNDDDNDGDEALSNRMKWFLYKEIYMNSYMHINMLIFIDMYIISYSMRIFFTCVPIIIARMSRPQVRSYIIIHTYEHN